MHHEVQTRTMKFIGKYIGWTTTHRHIGKLMRLLGFIHLLIMILHLLHPSFLSLLPGCLHLLKYDIVNLMSIHIYEWELRIKKENERKLTRSTSWVGLARGGRGGIEAWEPVTDLTRVRVVVCSITLSNVW